LENLPSPGGGKSSFFAASTSSAPTVLLRCRFGRAAIASSHPHARAGTRAQIHPPKRFSKLPIAGI
jgi:hypothetical protein